MESSFEKVRFVLTTSLFPFLAIVNMKVVSYTFLFINVFLFGRVLSITSVSENECI